MCPAPVSPKIYHITHVDNLPRILGSGALLSDARVIAQGGPAAGIGMSTIKTRRLGLPVDCHPGTRVGQYVPFYFCPRSIMLFVIHCANHPELAYKGGQAPIVHLEADLHAVVAWANAQNRRWAFSLSNAGAVYTQFRSDVGALGELNWTAIGANDFRAAEVKEGKQAEFLLYDSFPWELVSRVGVRSQAIRTQIDLLIAQAGHRPRIEIIPSWYF